MELERFSWFQKEEGFVASFSPLIPSRSFPHLLMAAFDTNEVILTFMDRCHGGEEKENVRENHTD